MGAPRLALTRATVTEPDGTQHKDRNVQVQGSLLRVYDGARLQAEVRTVDRADRLSQKVWAIVLADGTSWTVERGKGCGCRGGR